MHREELITLVIDTVQTELKTDTGDIHETTALADLRGFDSLVIVGLLERLEDRLQIEIDPALILPETFESPRTIAEILVRSQRHTGERLLSEEQLLQ